MRATTNNKENKMTNPNRTKEQEILRNAQFDDISNDKAAFMMSLSIDPEMMEQAIGRDQQIKALNRILYTGGRRSRTSIERKIDEARSDSRRMVLSFAKGANIQFGGTQSVGDFTDAIKAANQSSKGINIDSNIYIVEKYIYMNGGR